MECEGSFSHFFTFPDNNGWHIGLQFYQDCGCCGESFFYELTIDTNIEWHIRLLKELRKYNIAERIYYMGDFILIDFDTEVEAREAINKTVIPFVVMENIMMRIDVTTLGTEDYKFDLIKRLQRRIIDMYDF